MPQPTLAQTRLLGRIARSHLIKTRLPTRREPLWTIAGEPGGKEIEHSTIMRLILNGWLRPNRDGLGMFDESQTYRVLKVAGAEQRRLDAYEEANARHPLPISGEGES